MLKFVRGRAFFATVAGVLALAMLYPTLTFGQGTGTIVGTVTDSKTGKQLAYANVILLGTSMGAMTLEDGKFTIRGVPPGTYTVKAMMMGYKPG